MLPRIIPTIVVSNQAVWHTKFFNPEIYLGDPINISKLYSDLEADEITIFDISKSNRLFEDQTLEMLSAEVSVPISYGGGISDLSVADRVISRGIERLVIKVTSEESLELVRKISLKYGSQAVIGCINYQSHDKEFTNQRFGIERVDVEALAFRAIESGVGELLLQDISRSGTRAGLDTSLVEKIVDQTNIPIVVSGGTKNLECMVKALSLGVAGIAASTMFSLATSTDAPLVSYLSPRDREVILTQRLI
jgi:cyclase